MPAALRCFTITRDILQVLLVNNELLVKLCKQMAETNGGKQLVAPIRKS